MNHLRKYFVACSMCVILLVSACSNLSSEEENIRIGYVCGSVNALLAVAAIYDGTFERNGIEVEERCYLSGAETAQALINGEINLHLGAYEHVLSQRDMGLRVKAYAALYDNVGSALIVKNEASYQAPADLKNETLAIARSGSLSDTVLRTILNEAGLNGNWDVTIIGSGSDEAMMTALESNQVAAGMFHQPTVAAMVASGDYRVLVAPDYAYASGVVMARDAWVANNEDKLRTFLKSLREVYEKIEVDPVSMARTIADAYDQVDVELLAEVLAVELKNIPADLVISEESVAAVVDDLTTLGKVEEMDAFEEAVDLTLLQ